MLFNSAAFAFYFLPLVLAGFFACTHAGLRRTATIFLAAASLLFYGAWEPIACFLLIGSILFNYGAGVTLAGPRLGAHAKRGLLLAAICVDVALLVYFKYANFFTDSIIAATGYYFFTPRVILPLAISFFTFTQIAFLVDAYRGEAEDLSFFRYVLFVTFFPHLVAGPIYHHAEMMPQFAKMVRERIDTRNVAAGLTLFGIGLFKKVVFADTLATYADPIFSAASLGWSTTFFEAWVGLGCFALQLYFDFSGYTDMALGLALMLNVRMPTNFDSPYKATSIIDFWQRWHITLTRFLTDYIYTPLALSLARASRSRRRRWLAFAITAAIPMNVTFLVSGFWHGSGWNYVMFGVVNGLALTANYAWREARLRPLPNPLGWVLAMGTFGLSLVFFRSPTLGAAKHVIEGLAGRNGFVLAHDTANALGPLRAPLEWIGFEWNDVVGPYLNLDVQVPVLLGLAAFVLALPNSQQLLRPFRPVLELAHASPDDSITILGFDVRRLRSRIPELAFRYRGALAGAAVGAGISSLILWQSWTRPELVQFIYFQF